MPRERDYPVTLAEGLELIVRLRVCGEEDEEGESGDYAPVTYSNADGEPIDLTALQYAEAFEIAAEDATDEAWEGEDEEDEEDSEKVVTEAKSE